MANPFYHGRPSAERVSSQDELTARIWRLVLATVVVLAVVIAITASSASRVSNSGCIPSHITACA